MADFNGFRINRWYGGITVSDLDNSPGAHLNMEEVDILRDKNSVEPTTIFSADSTITRKITGYDIDDADSLWALGRDASGTPKAEIWKKTTASADSPGSWSSYKTSAENSNAFSDIKWHRYKIDISGITRSSTTATVTTSANHGLTTGDDIEIQGSNQTDYNITANITVTGVTTFTYTVANSPTTPATGTMSCLASFLFYVTGNNQLIRLGATPDGTTEFTADRAGTEMILEDLGTADDRIPMLRYAGRFFIGHGQYISQVDNGGVFIPKDFTLPDGWEAVSMEPFDNSIGILCRNVNNKVGHGKVYYWDLVATTGFLAEVTIPMGGPQIIMNHREVPWVIAAQNGTMRSYIILDSSARRQHTLYDISTETDTQAIVPDACKFITEDAMYFGLWKTDKTAMYSIGQVDSGFPYALYLAKRFNNPVVSSITNSTTTATLTTATVHGLTTSDVITVSAASESAYNGTFAVATVPSTTTLTYTMSSDPGGNATGTPIATSKSYDNHTPQAAFSAGPNMYAAFDDNGTPSVANMEGNNSPARSSNATIETIYIDAEKLEVVKEWTGFLLMSKVMPSSCTITVDARVDSATSYDSSSSSALTNSNDQVSFDGVTADTFWYREWKSVTGRRIQVRIAFTSSTTSRATLYGITLLAKNTKII